MQTSYYPELQLTTHIFNHNQFFQRYTRQINASILKRLLFIVKDFTLTFIFYSARSACTSD